MRICVFGTYRSEYVRNIQSIEQIKNAGVQVEICHMPFWPDLDGRNQIGLWGWMSPLFWWNFFKAFSQLLKKVSKQRTVDLFWLGYPGHLDVIFLRAYLFLNNDKRPIVWDCYMSLRLIAMERNYRKRNPVSLIAISILERMAYSCADFVVHDTKEYRHWFEEHYSKKNSERVLIIPATCDEGFYRLSSTPGSGDKFRCLYVGSFLASHGVHLICQAAKLTPDIDFIMLGAGPEKMTAQKICQELAITNVYFFPWQTETQVLAHLRHADVVLGAFANTPQSRMTLQNKILQGFAVGKPVLTGESQLVRRLFRDRVEIAFCDRQDSKSLARALRELKEQPRLRESIGRKGHEWFLKNATTAVGIQSMKQNLQQFKRELELGQG